MIVFADLSAAHARDIACMMLAEVSERAQALGVTLTFDPSVADFIVQTGYAPEKGARELRHAVTEHVEDALAVALLDGSVNRGMHVVGKVEDGKLTFTQA